jgi:hypothetical protein
MNQGTQGYRLTTKTQVRKSRDTVPLKWFSSRWTASKVLMISWSGPTILNLGRNISFWFFKPTLKDRYFDTCHGWGFEGGKIAPITSNLTLSGSHIVGTLLDFLLWILNKHIFVLPRPVANKTFHFKKLKIFWVYQNLSTFIKNFLIIN